MANKKKIFSTCVYNCSFSDPRRGFSEKSSLLSNRETHRENCNVDTGVISYASYKKRIELC